MYHAVHHPVLRITHHWWDCGNPGDRLLELAALVSERHHRVYCRRWNYRVLLLLGAVCGAVVVRKAFIMKPEDQIKALAELDGYFPFWCDLSRLWSWKSKDGKYRNFNQGLSEEHLVKITDYLISYDAIIPLIQKQSDLVQNNIVGSFKDEELWWSMTPPQLCEALLRATGKWTS